MILAWASPFNPILYCIMLQQTIIAKTFIIIDTKQGLENHIYFAMKRR